MLVPIDKEIERDIQSLAVKFLSAGEARIFCGGSVAGLNEDFKRTSEKLIGVKMETDLDEIFPQEESILIKYLSEAMKALHLRSLIDQGFFFEKIDRANCGLKNYVIRSGDHWGLVETNKLSAGSSKSWHLIDDIEVHIHEAIPGCTNSSLWLSGLLSSISQENVFIRPDIFRLNPKGTSSRRIELAAIYGRPFQKEWLETLKKTEIAEHEPDPRNGREQGSRTQFIWEPLLSQGKVQFAIEELPSQNSDLVSTRFIHGIYNLVTEKFEHFDGAIHIYNFDEYQIRLTQNLKNHNKNYDKAKIFLMDSGITIKQAENLLAAFYRWNTMPTEYFARSNPVSDHGYKG